MRDLAQEGARHPVDALGAHEVGRGGAVEHRGAALLPQDPGVDVALYDGVELGLGTAQARVRLGKGLLLPEDEGVCRAVERVVGEHAQRKRATDALVGHGQVSHAVAHGEHGARHVPVVHVMGQPVAPGRDGRKRGEARE